MLSTLKLIAADPNSDNIDHLVALINTLRPNKPELGAQAAEKVRILVQLLHGEPDQASALRHYVLRLFSTRRQISLYTDTGILPNAGFFTELFQRMSFRLLPPALDENYLRDCLDRLLPKETDYLWINAVPTADWLALFDLLSRAAPYTDAENNAASDAIDRHKTIGEMLEAIQTLSYRISAMGLEPALLRLYPSIDEFESPFLMQNVELHLYLNSYRQHLAAADSAFGQAELPPLEDARHLSVMLDQCETIVLKIRKNALRMGSSVSLTYLLVRLEQSIARLRKLLTLVDVGEIGITEPNTEKPEGPLDLGAIEAQATAQQLAKRSEALTLAQELIEGHNRKYAVRELFADNINLLARNVTENASRTGEHYIAEDRSEYATMFRSAAGAGFVIGFMSMLKILASYLRAAPLVEAFLFSMNYSLGFMLIHVLHFTVATKQPAMTASRIASGLQSHDGRNIDIDSLVELIVKVIRTQFIAVAGNLVIAFPAAYLIALCYQALFGHHLVSPDKAAHLLHDIDPFASLALFHAAIAGVCLFLAGLISGYYDNKALYTHMAKRVARAHWLRGILGEERQARFGEYLERNLGGLMGNFYFGILLGTIGTIGFMLGLPIDIRHITFSATNFATALVGLDNHMSWQTAVTSVIGVIGIGTVNLWVSFSLALFVALRARQVRFRHGLTLAKAVFKRFCKGPRDFFIPPKKVAIPEEEHPAA
ncbi:site-specific recombinase family protein [Collimonas arenae]|uniref:Site-specific recombinase family protein n=1 Tax=Collimonas arenae TaxID=279058 RepID=A0A127QIF2_9BURK|nr:site-specific recombinase [Collimonas arenae]AMP09776.1 site-specific recombinase family protein [Collimonas arenae]